MYFCGPTVNARAHIGNARPFVVGMWSTLAPLAVRRDARGNITDINDKIYDAAPGRSAELAERASRWYLEDTDALGLGRPDFEPKATESTARSWPDRRADRPWGLPCRRRTSTSRRAFPEH
jgi:cysteinyl-tRNA synthetase